MYRSSNTPRIVLRSPLTFWRYTPTEKLSKLLTSDNERRTLRRARTSGAWRRADRYTSQRETASVNNNPGRTLKRSHATVCHRYLPCGNPTCVYLRSYHSENYCPLRQERLYSRATDPATDLYFKRSVFLNALFVFLHTTFSSIRPFRLVLFSFSFALSDMLQHSPAKGHCTLQDAHLPNEDMLQMYMCYIDQDSRTEISRGIKNFTYVLAK